MSILRVGSTGKYADNWDNIFSGGKKKSKAATAKSTKKKSTKKPAKKAPAKKATAKKGKKK